MLAKGTFDVELKPESQEKERGIIFARMIADKVFQGNLEASSTVEMLAATADADGSGAYVAIDRVSGALGGRSGTFVPVHFGTRTPDSQ